MARQAGAQCAAAVISAFTMLCVFSPMVLGDSQALMDEMLNSYINATPGQVLDTQRRGGITFGSVMVRSRVVRPNFISIQPPSFRGGCQGFDLVGGSFSFINSEQLQQFLRAVASNALNYAFTLALDSVCPSCMQKMEKMRDWSEAINSKLMDSCHWANKLVNATDLDEIHSKQVERAKNKETLAGVVDDAFEAVDNFITPFVSDSNTGALTPTNVVMEALQRSGVQTWFGALGDQELMEVAMSVTGTVVKRPLNQAGAECTNAEGDRDYCTIALPSILTHEHFINGSDAGPVQIYACRDYPQCLDVVPEERTWPGLKTRVREILFGPPPGYTGGLVYKFRDPGAALTLREESFIEGAPLPVMTLLEGVANYPGSLITMGVQLSDMIIQQVARDMMMEIVSNVRKSLGQHGIELGAVMEKQVSEMIDEFAVRITYEDRQFDYLSKMLTLLQQVKRHVREQEPAGAQAPATARSNR